MKVHIVSLQRSGSKSLYNAIHKAMVTQELNPLMFDNGDTLGEFLHCWSEYGYKFGPTAQKPFDPNADIVFRTREEFFEYDGTNFTPRVDDGKLTWVPPTLKYQNQPRGQMFHKRVDILREVDSFVVKTQVASLFEDVYSTYRSEYESILFRSDLFTHTVFLTPDDPVKWLCSNYLCDHSGVFVKCTSQEEAALKFKEEPLTIPTEYMALL